VAATNRDRVGQALEWVGKGVRPFVERELKGEYGARWEEAARSSAYDGFPAGSRDPFSDVQLLLKLMWDQWNQVFRKVLGQAERTYVSELRDVRNRWAHQEAFSTDDAYRALDTAQRLLAAVSAEESVEVDRMKQEVMRRRYEEQVRTVTRKASSAPTEGQPATGLKPWRDVITPHPDVASGQFQQAEFAADLGQVVRGEGSNEYRDPREFFRRTYITEGLRDLLQLGIQRLAARGGDPTVALQTNFGGGKTHSLLALYHLFSGASPADLPGIEPVLKAAGIAELPKVHRAVLVGTAIAPGSVHEKADGTKVRTLWGELAWQLGGREGYEIVAEDDATGKNPGDHLRQLFEKYGPCLILIDEWVAYARQLPRQQDGEPIPAGTFDTHFTFAQALTEAVKAAKGALLVVSMPASDIEKGGEAGRIALERLENLVARQDSPWRPASAEESFEIVRRRLFQDVSDHPARDVVVKAFGELYRTQAPDFPSECREGEYERRLSAAYPIHAELFARLYDDWSALENFQRTRGVLRLMAAVIHWLWENDDRSLMILPGTVPVGDSAVQRELTRYIESSWVPVIDRDVDGPSSLPLKLDQDNPALQRYSATRRVARAIFLGSAATSKAAHQGLDDQHIKLGCVQPGEGPAVFGDALRRLSDQATFLYADGTRYWYSTQPTVARLAHDRASQQTEHDVLAEIVTRLRADKERGDFPQVHIAPEGPGDIPDEMNARLVVLGPEVPHAGKRDDTSALQAAGTILEQRGAGPRTFRNSLVFAAADIVRLDELKQSVRQWLAWQSIARDQEDLNLDTFQRNQAAAKRDQANETVRTRMRETYTWAIVPAQEPQKKLVWQEIRIPIAPEALALRISRKLHDEEHLLTKMAGSRLRLEVDRVPLWEGNHVGIKKLRELFAQYLYLPRLRDELTLLEAIQDGIGRFTWDPDTFAYADSWDDTTKRYVGLVAGNVAGVGLDSTNLIVKPEVAAKQLQDEGAVIGASTRDVQGGDEPLYGRPVDQQGADREVIAVRERLVRRFHGTIALDPLRVVRDTTDIAEAIVQHLSGLPGSHVEVTVEIHAELTDGVPPEVVRTVTENARTLKFKTYGFEEE
jgi:predicted AAA+ superfamily ATPase